MKDASLSDDIAFARAMAEEGATTPTLSGRFAVMWGTLVTLALLAHWTILAGFTPWDQQMAGLVWLIMGLSGGIGSVILGRSLRDKPGQSAAGNQAEEAAWPVVSISLFSIAIATAVAVIIRDQPPILFDMLIPIAFGFYAVMTAMSSRLFRKPASQWRIWLAIALAALSAALIGLPEVYLIAAAGVVVTQVLPGITALRAEPDAVV